VNTLGTLVIIMALAAAVVGAGALSVLSFPLVAGRLAAPTQVTPPRTAAESPETS
jgi:hypothetical protein